ncbi:methyl-accepting chemotaxis protein [Halarsenatibacter silvermanii]|uniref:Methyl-accepting chemotaxis protein (MCP) signalling domain-containing protein n=1 Tax=Halarsenatibacter silvermanii TaxID=321763 RepID=A0A1G9LTX0_9FIRM|nr:methyl-accepting chemotaxis protein [Halarsenatibacter silvermanii]SDL65181.1 Methyl-accepting chemotaxis protein (MCP) signalling domain-containing protein [Halarsenatibacter silvermanii]
MSLLESFIDVAPYLNELVTRDTAVAVTNRNEYLCYESGEKLDHGVSAGKELKEGSLVVRAMQQREVVSDRVEDEELFGVKYIGVARPVQNESGEVIGAVFLGESTDRQDHLKEIAGEVKESVSDLRKASEEISAQAEELSASINELDDLAGETDEEMESVEKVINMVRDIASQTNLLGLNAQIEAARVGEEGRGFEVVAQEIRELSEQTENSLGEIMEIMGKIEELSGSIKDVTEDVQQIADSQAAYLEETSASTQELDDMASTLNDMAKMIDSRND